MTRVDFYRATLIALITPLVLTPRTHQSMSERLLIPFCIRSYQCIFSPNSALNALTPLSVSSARSNWWHTNPIPAGLDRMLLSLIRMSSLVIINSLHMGGGQILMIWCIYAMYDSRNLVGCYGALGKTTDDDKVEAF